MDDCETCQRLMVDALFDEAPDGSGTRRRLDQHLDQCSACAEAFREMRRTLRAMDRRERPSPSPAYWAAYEDQLMQRLELAPQENRAAEETRSHRASWLAFLSEARQQMAALLQPRALALAVVLAALGFWLGRASLTPGSSLPSPSLPSPSLEEHTAAALSGALLKTTQLHLARSKVLLLDLRGVDLAQSDSGAVGLAAKRGAARSLAREASALEGQLTSSEQQRLRALLADLRATLAKIASLEQTADLEGLGLVQDQIDRSNLLTRIDAEQLRLSGYSLPDPLPSATASNTAGPRPASGLEETVPRRGGVGRLLAQRRAPEPIAAQSSEDASTRPRFSVSS